MRRIAAVLAAASLFLAGAGAGTFAGSPGDEPPPLTPPALKPATPAPPAATPAGTPPVVNSTPAPENRAVLVVPGVTRPRTVARPVRPAPAQPPTPTPTEIESSLPEAMPVLVGPAGMSAPAAGTATAPEPGGRPRAGIGGMGRPLTIESIPTPPGEAPPTILPGRRPLTEPPPRRPQGLFGLGRLFPPPPAANRDRARGVPAEASPADEPSAETAADAALKRRIVKQIRENLGSRVTSFDVRVSGRAVEIKAKAARFWQRRGVRHDLQTLPVLTGFKAVVELID